MLRPVVMLCLRNQVSCYLKAVSRLPDCNLTGALHHMLLHKSAKRFGILQIEVLCRSMKRLATYPCRWEAGVPAASVAFTDVLLSLITHWPPDDHSLLSADCGVRTILKGSVLARPGVASTSCNRARQVQLRNIQIEELHAIQTAHICAASSRSVWMSSEPAYNISCTSDEPSHCD